MKMDGCVRVKRRRGNLTRALRALKSRFRSKNCFAVYPFTKTPKLTGPMERKEIIITEESFTFVHVTTDATDSCM